MIEAPWLVNGGHGASFSSHHLPVRAGGAARGGDPALHGGRRADGAGEPFPRVHWFAVPKALRARRVNMHGGRRAHGGGAPLFHVSIEHDLRTDDEMDRHVGESQPRRSLNDAPCPPFTGHGASIMLQ
jgi:hypothetical protein